MHYPVKSKSGTYNPLCGNFITYRKYSENENEITCKTCLKRLRRLSDTPHAQAQAERGGASRRDDEKTGGV